MVGNWKKVKDTSVTVKFKNIKTKKVIIGAKDYGLIYGPKWLPVHPDGHLIAGLDTSTTKQGIIGQLKIYMRANP